jgi:dTDP-4-amino-4,6-dideoxygalactose transaminase
MKVLVDLAILIDVVEGTQVSEDSKTAIEFLLERGEAYIPSFTLLKIDLQKEKFPSKHQQFLTLLSNFKIAKTPSYLNLGDSVNYSSIENYLFSIGAQAIGAQFILTSNRILLKDLQSAISPEYFVQKVISQAVKADVVVPFLSLQRVNNPYEPQLEMAFDEVMKSGWYLLGSKLKKFEDDYARFNSVNHCVGLSNGLDALHLSLLALGVGVGDEVIVPSNTYIATVLSVTFVGATPVFVEPNARTYNIDPMLIEARINPKTKTIMPVHLYGQACEMDAIMRIAEKHKLFVVEDNAQSQGASYNQKLVGSFGQINGTSFYPGKNLGALGDAGAITTNDPVLAQKVATLRNYGSNKKYFNEVVGHNMRMDEMQAAFLIPKLKDLTNATQQRQQAAAWYLEALEGVGDIVLPYTAEGATHVYHLFVIRTAHRDSLKDYLAKAFINTLIHYPVPPHLQEAYKDLGHCAGDFPVAEALANTSLSLPIWPGMKKKEVDHVVSVIRAFYAGN